MLPPRPSVDHPGQGRERVMGEGVETKPLGTAAWESGTEQAQWAGVQERGNS